MCPHTSNLIHLGFIPSSSLSFLAPNLLTYLVNISFCRFENLLNVLGKVSGSSISSSCANSSSSDKAVNGEGEEVLIELPWFKINPDHTGWWFRFCLVLYLGIELPLASVWFLQEGTVLWGWMMIIRAVSANKDLLQIFPPAFSLPPPHLPSIWGHLKDNPVRKKSINTLLSFKFGFPTGELIKR